MASTVSQIIEDIRSFRPMDIKFIQRCINDFLDEKYHEPKRTTIGKVCNNDATLMYPNDNYYKFFPAEEFLEVEECDRSGCLKIGTYLVIEKISLFSNNWLIVQDPVQCNFQI